MEANIARSAKITTSHCEDGFKPEKIIDGEIETCWICAEDRKEAEVRLRFVRKIGDMIEAK